jgi:hypothetical protein
MKQKRRNEFHEIDPRVRYEDVAARIREEHPWSGEQSKLAQILGVTRAQVHLWSKREDGLIPPPWNWRIQAMFEREGNGIVEQPAQPRG